MADFFKIYDYGKIPSKAHSDDAGYDLYSDDNFTINPGQTKIITTGIGVKLKKGQVGLIMDKSGLASKGLITLGGVIDSGYTGEIRVVIHNLGKVFYKFDTFDKVAQLVIQNHDTSNANEITKPNIITDRGTGSFGSTGKK